jgi:hypothetical protein
LRDRQPQRPAHHDQREQTERQISGKDPAPAQVIDDETAQQGTTDRGQDVHAAQQPQVAAAFPGADDLTEHRLRTDHQSAAARALDDPRGHQRGH